jgi:hypothetical protein
MPTGNDLRKNNQAGILSFGEFNKEQGNKYHLVITSFFDPAEVTELSKLAPNIVFTGNVSGGELDYLYQECEALFFPSEYEGLGLPVLEAAEKNKPVACSDIAVFREMSKTAFIYFDPTSVVSMAKALAKAVDTKTIDKAEYKRVVDKYDWTRTADLVVEALLSCELEDYKEKHQLAVFGINPECDTMLARTIQSSYAELSRQFKTQYFLEGHNERNDRPRPSMLYFAEGTSDITSETAINLEPEQLALYNLANTEWCAKTLFAALARPGIAILHELDVTRAWQTLQSMGMIDESRLTLEKDLQEQSGSSATGMLVSVIANQRAVIVFSEVAKREVEQILAACKLTLPVLVAAHPAASLVYDDIIPQKDSSAARFGAGEDADSITAPHDRDVEEALSRTAYSLSTNSEELALAFEGMRYGVVSLYAHGKQALPWELPESFIKADSVDKASSVLKDLARDRKDYQAKSRATQAEVTAEHSYRSYADGLYELVQQLNGGSA